MESKSFFEDATHSNGFTVNLLMVELYPYRDNCQLADFYDHPFKGCKLHGFLGFLDALNLITDESNRANADLEMLFRKKAKSLQSLFRRKKG